MLMARWIDWSRRFFFARPPAAGSTPIEKGEYYLIARIRNRELVSRAPSDSPIRRMDNFGEPFLALDVVAALGARIPSKDKRRLVTRLLREQKKGAWAYASWGGIDVDTTASAIRALDRLGHEIPLDGLKRFFNPENGLYNT